MAKTWATRPNTDASSVGPSSGISTCAAAAPTHILTQLWGRRSGEGDGGEKVADSSTEQSRALY